MRPIRFAWLALSLAGCLGNGADTGSSQLIGNSDVEYPTPDMGPDMTQNPCTAEISPLELDSQGYPLRAALCVNGTDGERRVYCASAFYPTAFNSDGTVADGKYFWDPGIFPTVGGYTGTNVPSESYCTSLSRVSAPPDDVFVAPTLPEFYGHAPQLRPAPGGGWQPFDYADPGFVGKLHGWNAKKHPWKAELDGKGMGPANVKPHPFAIELSTKADCTKVQDRLAELEFYQSTTGQIADGAFLNTPHITNYCVTQNTKTKKIRVAFAPETWVKKPPTEKDDSQGHPMIAKFLDGVDVVVMCGEVNKTDKEVVKRDVTVMVDGKPVKKNLSIWQRKVDLNSGRYGPDSDAKDLPTLSKLLSDTCASATPWVTN